MRSEPKSDWLRGLASIAYASGELNFEHVTKLVEMFASLRALERAENGFKDSSPHEFNRPTIDELAALSGVAEAIISRRVMDATPPISSKEKTRLFSLRHGYCEDIVMPIIASLGAFGEPDAVAAWAENVGFARGGKALHMLVLHGALREEVLAWVVGNIDIVEAARGDPKAFRDRLPTYFADLQSWLISIGDAEPLPAQIIDRLLEQIETLEKSGSNETARELLLVVSRNSLVSREPYISRIRALLATKVVKRPPLPIQ